MQFKCKYGLIVKNISIQAIQFTQTIQFSISMLLVLRARVDLGAMVMKGLPYYPKLQHCWNLTIRLFSVISGTLVGGGCRIHWLQRCSQCILQPQPTGQIQTVCKCKKKKNFAELNR